LFELDTHFVLCFYLQRKECVWQQEFYSPFEYKTPRNNFHTFEADENRAGLYFADETEANEFHAVIESRKQKLGKYITFYI